MASPRSTHGPSDSLKTNKILVSTNHEDHPHLGNVMSPGGLLGYKRDGGGSDGAYYFAPKKIHGPYIVHPKKYKTGHFRPNKIHDWLELHKNYYKILTAD